MERNQYPAEVADKRNQVDAIYTDFSKAFDWFDHDPLIMKLDSFGMSHALLRLPRS